MLLWPMKFEKCFILLIFASGTFLPHASGSASMLPLCTFTVAFLGFLASWALTSGPLVRKPVSSVYLYRMTLAVNSFSGLYLPQHSWYFPSCTSNTWSGISGITIFCRRKAKGDCWEFTSFELSWSLVSLYCQKYEVICLEASASQVRSFGDLLFISCDVVSGGSLLLRVPLD